MFDHPPAPLPPSRPPRRCGALSRGEARPTARPTLRDIADRLRWASLGLARLGGGGSARLRLPLSRAPARRGVGTTLRRPACPRSHCLPRRRSRGGAALRRCSSMALAAARTCPVRLRWLRCRCDGGGDDKAGLSKIEDVARATQLVSVPAYQSGFAKAASHKKGSRFHPDQLAVRRTYH